MIWIRRFVWFPLKRLGPPIIISILTSLLVLELFLRVFSPQQLMLIRPDIYQTDPILGWKHRPMVDTIVNTGEGPIRLVTDELGYRIVPGVKTNQASRRFLVIGDSMMEALQVNGEQTTPEVLRALWQNNTGESIHITNTGVGDWDPNQYLIQTRLELAREHYDLGLIFIYLGNDLISEVKTKFGERKSARHHFRFPSVFTWQEISDAWLYPLNDFLEMRSNLFVFFKKAFSVVLMRFGLTGYSMGPMFLRENAEAPFWRVTTQIAESIHTTFQSYNTPFLFVFIPASYQVDPKDFDRLVRGLRLSPDQIDLDQPNRILGELFKERGLPVIDPLHRMRALHREGRILYGIVDNHLNAAGYRTLAETVLPEAERILQVNQFP